jgi:hypothetical protein
VIACGARIEWNFLNLIRHWFVFSFFSIKSRQQDSIVYAVDDDMKQTNIALTRFTSTIVLSNQTSNVMFNTFLYTLLDFYQYFFISSKWIIQKFGFITCHFLSKSMQLRHSKFVLTPTLSNIWFSHAKSMGNWLVMNASP